MTACPTTAPTFPVPGALIDSPVWTRLAWAGLAVFAAGLALLLALGRWPEAQIAAGFFVPFLVVMLIPHGLPSLLDAAIAAAFLVSGAGWAFDWYTDLWWFDIVVHALNPFIMMAGSMFMLWKADLLAHAPRKGRFVLWSTAIGLALGIGWELVELTYLTLTWPDTILDLVMDAAGAALGGWLAIWLIEQRGRSPAGRGPKAARTVAWIAQRVPVPVRRAGD